MSLWVLVPIRGLATGKSRLAPVMDNELRAQLNAQWLDKSLDAVEGLEGSLARCLVVSAGADALEQARLRGARVLAEGTPCGLNASLHRAREYALAHGASRLLVLAADLPGVTDASLRTLLQTEGGRSCATIVADKTGTGTNGLLVPAAAALRFSFGEGSLLRHRALLEAAGLAVRIWHDEGLAFDVDTPDDLRRWRESLANGVSSPH